MSTEPLLREVAAPAPPSPELPLSTIVTWCLPLVPTGFVSILTTVYFAKYGTDVLLVAPGTLSVIFLVSRLWDAAADPLVGYLSDRTRGRLDRRRSWILGSTLPLALFTWMLWVPPGGLGEWGLAVWLAIAVFGFHTAHTVLDVPHAALGAELSFRPHDRTRLFGGRALVFGVTTLLAFTLGIGLLRTSADPRATAPWLIGILAILGCAALAWLVFRLREPQAHQGRGAASLWSAYRDVLANPHARLVLFVFFVEHLGFGALSVLAPFLLEYVAGVPQLTEVFLGFYFVPHLIAIPFWVRLARRYPRHRLWQVAMLGSALAFGSMFLVSSDFPWVLVATGTLAGVFGACGIIMAPAIQSDIVDYDELLTGERKEGAYFAAWALVRKSSFAITSAVALAALAWVGYVPNAEQTETTKLVIRTLAGLLPMAGFLVGLVVFLRYDLTEEAHARIRAEIDRRRGTAFLS